MEATTLSRLQLARYLFELSKSSFNDKNDVGLFACVNLAQDAVEAFLVGLADHLDASLPEKPDFDKYFSEINKKTGRELPSKNRLLRLNKLRVSSKHHGIKPPREECLALISVVESFFDQVARDYIGIEFSTLSLIDLFSDGEVKDYLIEADDAFKKQEFERCLILCRKAIYVEIESRYDISRFDRDFKPKSLADMMAFECKAPFFAQSHSYIDSKVKEPIDFIVIPSDELNASLSIAGASPTQFWNICRLTPSVWRSRETRDWYIKMVAEHFNEGFFKENAEYVLASTFDLLFAIDADRKKSKYVPHRYVTINLAQEGVPVYSKADSGSMVVGYTPVGCKKVSVSYCTMGIRDRNAYWKGFAGTILGGVHGYFLQSDLRDPPSLIDID